MIDQFGDSQNKGTPQTINRPCYGVPNFKNPPIVIFFQFWVGFLRYYQTCDRSQTNRLGFGRVYWLRWLQHPVIVILGNGGEATGS